jgi:hypothetical protein
MSMPSHADDGVAKATLAVARYRYRVMLAMALSSHTDDGATYATWPWRNADVESCQ